MPFTMTLRQFADHLERIAVAQPRLEREALNAAGRTLREEARGYLGEYQAAAGPFPAWPALAPYTVERRVALGFTPDDPLLRTGELAASIGYSVRGRLLRIGSPLQVAFWQEFGTEKIPPRSFLGRALAVRGPQTTRTIAFVLLRPLLFGVAP